MRKLRHVGVDDRETKGRQAALERFSTERIQGNQRPRKAPNAKGTFGYIRKRHTEQGGRMQKAWSVYVSTFPWVSRGARCVSSSQ